MRIGILTYHFAYNYGAMLQAYALQTYLQSKGIDSEIIDYRPYAIDKSYHFYWRDIIYAKKKFLKHFLCRERKLFDDFMEKYMKLSERTSKADFERQNIYDIILVGSDQVWNLEISHADMTYFLPNIHAGVCRAAYAPSIKNYQALEPYKEEICHFLKQFKYLSGREIDVVNFLKKEVGVTDAKVVVDPVFLLENEDWKKLSVVPEIPCKRYVLFYVLAKDSTLLEWCEQIKKTLNLSVVTIHPLSNITGYGDYFFSNIGPQEFLGLIQNAECVVTNSFHCSSFSVLFNKQFFVGEYECVGERLRNVIDMIGAKKHAFGDSEIYYFQNESAEMLDTCMIESKAYLEAIIKTESNLNKNIAP